MDFFSMKRKKLQSLCKKHGIPANLKNKDMAEKLSLIYKEENNENPGSRRLRSDADKSNVEIIVLDSDSDSDVQTEALGTAAGNADACEVKPATPREHNVHDMIDSGTAAGNEDACEVKLTPERSGNVGSFYVEDDINMSANVLEAFGNYMMLGDQTSSENTYVHEDSDYHCVSQAAKTCHDASPGVKNTEDNTNVNVENILDEVHLSSFENSNGTPAQFLKTNPLSEVETSDLDADKMVATGTAAGNEDACEVKLTPERSGNVGSFYVEEDINMSANVLEAFGNYMMLGDQTSSENTYVHEDSDYHCVSQAAKTCHDASPGVKNTEDNTNVNVENILDEVHLSSFENSNGTPAQFLKTNPLSEVETSDLDADKMVATGTVTKSAYTSGAKFELSQKMSISPASKEMMEFSPKLFNNPGSPTNGDIGFCGLEENLEIGVNKENIDANEDVMHAEPSVMVLSDNENLIQAVSEEPANNLMEDEVGNVDDKFDLVEDVPGSVNPGSKKNADLNTYVSGGDILDEVHSSSFEDSDVTPVRFLTTDPLREAETSDLDVPKMFEIATATNADTSGAKFGSSQKMTVSPASKEILEIGVNNENIDPNEDVMHEEPSALVMSDNEDLIHAVSEELGNKLMEESLEIGVNKENIDSNEDVIYAEPSVMVMSDNEDLIQAVSEELGNNLMEDEVANVEDKFDLLEDFLGSVNPGGTNSTHEEPSALVMSDNEDLIHAVSEELGNKLMEESLEIGVNTENIDSNEDVIYAEPSVMVMSDNEDLIQAVSEELGNNLMEDEVANVEDKFDLLEDFLGSVNPGGTNSTHEEPSALVMSDNEDLIHAVSEELGNKLMEESLEIGVNTENIDSNEDVIYAEPSVMVMSDNEDLIQAVSEELGNNLMEDEVANVEDKFDLLEDFLGSVNPGGTNSTHGSNIKTVPLREAETSDLVLDKMFETATATKNEDISGVKTESLPKMSLYPTLEKMIGSSSFEDSDGTPVQFLPTDPLREAESSDLYLHKMFETATATKNADISGVKVESLPKMSLYPTPEKMIGSSIFEDSDGTPVQFLPTDPLREAETSDLDLHKMFETATATKNADTSGVKFESSTKMSLSITPEKMIGSSTKLLNNSGTPTNFGFCDVDENLQIGANKENIDHSDKVLHAEPSLVVRSDDEEVDLSIYQMAAQEASEEEMLKSSEKTCMVADPEECIGFSLNDLQASTTKCSEAETYFESTALSDVMETCNMEGSMQTNMMEEETYSVSRKRKMGDVDVTSGANSTEEVKADELVPAVPQSSGMECDFGLQNLFAQDTPIASGEKSIIFTPKLRESSMTHKKTRIEMNLSQKPATRDSDMMKEGRTCDMKENIKIAKKEEVSSTVSRNKFTKRLALQDLHQN